MGAVYKVERLQSWLPTRCEVQEKTRLQITNSSVCALILNAYIHAVGDTETLFRDTYGCSWKALPTQQPTELLDSDSKCVADDPDSTFSFVCGILETEDRCLLIQNRVFHSAYYKSIRR